MTHLRLVQLPASEGPSTQSNDAVRPLQRLHIVRRLQGMSPRAVARRLQTTIVHVRVQEQPTADIALSELYRWQRALEVPIAELVAESGETLAASVQQRAQLLRLMRTVAQILEVTDEEPVREMAQMLFAELTEVMPELQDVSAWHLIGRRRRQDEYGVAVDRGVTDAGWQSRKAA
jgi:hypothetical protein